MIIRETLEGPVGKKIRDSLLELIGSLDDATIEAARNGSKPYGDVRYTAGCADGVRFALNTIMDLGKTKP